MSKHECAVVMAYTGVCMLAGEDFNIFHRYAEKLMERPVCTHELPALADEIKRRAECDFIELCRSVKEG